MMMTRLLLCSAALMVAAGAHAQSSQPAISLNGTPASAPVSSPAKKELLQRLMNLQQPALEGLARDLAERPARQMLSAADPVLQQRVAADKRQAVATQIQGYVRKYLEEAVPIVKDKAGKVAQSTLLPMFEEKFTEDELRQLLSALENPAYKKYQQALPELSSAFLQKLVAESQPSIDPKLKALEQNIASSLGVTAAAAPAAKPPAAAASKPAKK